MVEGQSCNYYILSWALKNDIQKISINVIGKCKRISDVNATNQRSRNKSYKISYQNLSLKQERLDNKKIIGWLGNEQSWPSGRSLIASGHSKQEVIDCVRLGLYLRSKGEKISIKIHPHYYRRNKKVVNGIIEIYNIDKLITEKPLNELMEEHDICYCNLDSVVKVMAELGKPCIPIVSNKYPTFMEKPDEGNVEVI